MKGRRAGSCQPKAAVRGEPSYVWRFGQERRLALIQRYVKLDDAAILDIGCGIGTYIQAFRRFTARAYGIDIDAERVAQGSRSVPGLAVAVSEYLPFKDQVFDLVLLNEVIEHVQDDVATLREAARVLRPGGTVIVYAPNRLYPFETHGVYLGRRYVFGNIPLVNWLPGVLRRRLVPHARTYLARDIRRILRGLDADLVEHSYVYPGFDNIAARWPMLGRLLRTVLYFAEGTPLRIFGLSHFVVLRKRRAPALQYAKSPGNP